MNNEQQRFYDECVASGKFDWKQMAEIRWGFERNLTTEQVATYADTKFNAAQMRRIRKQQTK